MTADEWTVQNTTYIRSGGAQWYSVTHSYVTLYVEETETLLGLAAAAWAGEPFTPLTLGLCQMPNSITLDLDLILYSVNPALRAHERMDTVVCGEEDPYDFVLIRPRNFKFREIENDLERRMAASDFNYAKMTGKPLFQEIRSTVDGERKHYRRLLLPLGAEKADRIHVVSRDMTVTVKKPERVLQ